MSCLHYEAINIPEIVNPLRCKSATVQSTTLGEYESIKEAWKMETISLPGQVEINDAQQGVTIVLDHMTAQPVIHNEKRSGRKHSQISTSENDVEKDVEHTCGNDSEGSSSSMELCDLTSPDVELFERHSSPLNDQSQYQDASMADLDLFSVPLNERPDASMSALRIIITNLLYLVAALITYPLLIILLPFSLTTKLLSFLCCCIPCKRRTKKVSQFSPLYFSSQTTGGYYTIAVVLKERLSPQAFVKHVATKVNDAVSDVSSDRENTLALSLMSKVRKDCCFTWRERVEKVELDQHVHIMDKRQMITTNDFTNFIAEISHKENHGKEWSVYFIPYFKKHFSAIVLRAHHSLASRIMAKDIFIHKFAIPMSFCHDRSLSRCDDNLPQLSQESTIFRSPGIVLYNLLRPSHNIFSRQRPLCGRQRYAISNAIPLQYVHQLKEKHNISVYSLFLTCLTEAFRKHLHSQNGSLHDVTVAIPVTNSGWSNTSLFFLTLPVSQRSKSREQLSSEIDKQLQRNHKDAQVFLSATKLGTFLFPSCIVNHLTSSVVKQASVVFKVINCSRHTLYFSAGRSISSVAFWPPLFKRFRMGVCILCYEDSFYVSIVTDQNVTDWPDVILSNYVSAYFDLLNDSIFGQQ